MFALNNKASYLFKQDVNNSFNKNKLTSIMLKTCYHFTLVIK